MKIAVVGSGVAGLSAAWLLQRRHDVTVFEADTRLGGHAHTVSAEVDGVDVAVDTGFIVFNHRTYPLFCRMLDELGVAEKLSSMTFSASIMDSGVEYAGTDLDRLFVQRSNLLRPSFWRMVLGIRRFYRESRSLLDSSDGEVALGEYLATHGYPQSFIDDHLLPMASAVWSTDRARMMSFPASFLVRFFEHHGFLELENRPDWYTVEGGSIRYVDAIAAVLGDAVRCSTPVRGVTPCAGAVELHLDSGTETFDHVVLATHVDTSLRLLKAPTAAQESILGKFSCRTNAAVLHTDAGMMPRNQRAWASWNTHVGTDPGAPPTLTYWMNHLQSLPVPTPILLTLNREDEIDPRAVLGRWDYDHPIFTPDSVAAAARLPEIQGCDGIWFAGAAWGYGFHEDGVRSGVQVARALGVPFGEDLPRRPLDLIFEADR